jgi:hypothetical protein
MYSINCTSVPAYTSRGSYNNKTLRLCTTVNFNIKLARLHRIDTGSYMASMKCQKQNTVRYSVPCTCIKYQNNTILVPRHSDDLP